jgi:SAM-dependent methyltransferase
MNLNVGSGQRRFGPGWINVDLQVKKPEQVPDVQARGEQLPILNEAAETVVLHHVLEHYGCGEAVSLLQECWRVTQPGGRLLIFVPDMRALAQRFLNRQLDAFLFMANVYGAYQGSEADRHKWGYTDVTLAALLRSALGFEFLLRSYRDDRAPEGADIAWDWWILGVECIKHLFQPDSEKSK